MEPWFDANAWAWLPGTLLGIVGGTWGTLAGVLAPRGKGRSLLLTMNGVFLVAGVLLCGAGLYGLSSGQPFGVWYALLLPGFLTLAVFGPLGWVLRRAYRLHEERRMQARDF